MSVVVVSVTDAMNLILQKDHMTEGYLVQYSKMRICQTEYCT